MAEIKTTKMTLDAALEMYPTTEDIWRNMPDSVRLALFDQAIEQRNRWKRDIDRMNLVIGDGHATVRRLQEELRVTKAKSAKAVREAKASIEELESRPNAVDLQTLKALIRVRSQLTRSRREIRDLIESLDRIL
jgi:hypothetical protein